MELYRYINNCKLSCCIFVFCLTLMNRDCSGQQIYNIYCKEIPLLKKALFVNDTWYVIYSKEMIYSMLYPDSVHETKLNDTNLIYIQNILKESKNSKSIKSKSIKKSKITIDSLTTIIYYDVVFKDSVKISKFRLHISSFINKKEYVAETFFYDCRKLEIVKLGFDNFQVYYTNSPSGKIAIGRIVNSICNNKEKVSYDLIRPFVTSFKLKL